MGKIASLGVPTYAIREVFVHAGSYPGRVARNDPNPLFPCAVCENMLRRVSKDVLKAHGGDVILYMFDGEHDPRKLVMIPILEMSHREGATFRRFLEDDVRGDEMGEAEGSSDSHQEANRIYGNEIHRHQIGGRARQVLDLAPSSWTG